MDCLMPSEFHKIIRAQANRTKDIRGSRPPKCFCNACLIGLWYQNGTLSLYGFKFPKDQTVRRMIRALLGLLSGLLSAFVMLV